jgi:hypothetical protein
MPKEVLDARFFSDLFAVVPIVGVSIIASYCRHQGAVDGNVAFYPFVSWANVSDETCTISWKSSSGPSPAANFNPCLNKLILCFSMQLEGL